LVFVQFAILGLAAGAVYALLAAGLVVVYRTTGVLNFAHAAMGTVSAYIFFEAARRLPLPAWVAALLAIAFGAGLGWVLSAVVFARLRGASPLSKVIVSLGISGLLQGAMGLVWGFEGKARPPQVFPAGVLHIGNVNLAWQQVGMIGSAVLCAIALSGLFRRTNLGIALRAVAQNRLAARLVGVAETRVIGAAWAIGGGLAALAAVLETPMSFLAPVAMEGFLVKAFTAALIGGLANVRAAVVGGLALGAIEGALTAAPAPFNGLKTPLAAALILVLLVARIDRVFVSEHEAAAIESEEPSTAAAIASERGARRSPIWLVVLGCALALPVLGGSYWSYVGAQVAVYALAGLSLVVLTGLVGQISLMTAAFVGVGAFAAAFVGTRLETPLLLAIPIAGLITVPISVLVGFPALRLRGLHLGIATLGFATLVESTLFQSNWFANGGKTVHLARPTLGGVEMSNGMFYVLALAVASMLFLFVRNLMRSKVGRAFAMVRDNEAAAQGLGMNIVKYKLLAFCLAGFFAGVSGALYAYLLQNFTAKAFTTLGAVQFSLSIFFIAILGGVRSVKGPVIGALLVIGVNEALRGLDILAFLYLTTFGLALVVVCIIEPLGIAGLMARARAPVRRLLRAGDAA